MVITFIKLVIIVLKILGLIYFSPIDPLDLERLIRDIIDTIIDWFS